MNQNDDSTDLIRAIEAVVLASTEPVEAQLLAQLTERPIDEIEAICAEMIERSSAEARGYVMARVAGGYRFQTHPDMAEYVERFVLEGQHARLSPAALETLAIVAYKQPISRAQASAIRGVNVDAVVRTLQQRGLIDEVGTDPGPGNAILYGTTRDFLDRLGINSLGDLPPLSEFVPDAEVVETLERTLRAEPVTTVPAPDESPGGDTAG